MMMQGYGHMPVNNINNISYGKNEMIKQAQPKNQFACKGNSALFKVWMYRERLRNG